jgi:NADPH-dependent curcumin reductase CurA
MTQVKHLTSCGKINQINAYQRKLEKRFVKYMRNKGLHILGFIITPFLLMLLILSVT